MVLSFKNGATKLNHNNKNDSNYVVYDDDDDAFALDSFIENAILENQDQKQSGSIVNR